MSVLLSIMPVIHFNCLRSVLQSKQSYRYNGEPIDVLGDNINSIVLRILPTNFVKHFQSTLYPLHAFIYPVLV